MELNILYIISDIFLGYKISYIGYILYTNLDI